MEPFVVSALKYRPQTFKDVVGQTAITNTLKNAIDNNHLAQALLFTGPRGVGKTTCARILAKMINSKSSENERYADQYRLLLILRIVNFGFSILIVIFNLYLIIWFSKMLKFMLKTVI